MAVRFPDARQPVDTVEIDIKDSFDLDCNSTSHLIRVGKNGLNSGELSHPRGLAVDINSNHIYVTEESPVRVSIFSESGEFLNDFTHEEMKRPCGIEIRRNNVYVTDIGIHGVFHFKIEPEISLYAALVGEGSDDGEFNEPLQLTVSDDGEVFVADYFNNRIQILNKSLHFQRSIKLDPTQCPRDVKLTFTEVFVLTDSSPCVIVFSHAGEKLRSFITRGEEMQAIGPRFFCLDAKQNLIMSDFGTICVKIFSPDARLVHSIEMGKVCFSVPGGIALTKELKVVVIARYGPPQLQIYSF